MEVDLTLAFVAAAAATLFALDLLNDLLRGFRPHTAAFAMGIGMFAAATWALAGGLGDGWSGVEYRTFFLFGAILNIPFLALGSMFLVVGRKSGNAMLLALGAFSAVAITFVTTVPFAEPLPESGLVHDVFPPIDAGFGPRLLAAIGGGTGALILIMLAIASIFRFWRDNRRVVAGNVLIVAGTLAASAGGTLLGFMGETAAFEVSLLAAVTLIWIGYRVARGVRTRQAPQAPLIVLVGPSTESPERAHAELMISELEKAGYRVMCPARDVEVWGDVGYTPAEVMRRTFDSIDEADAVVVDLSHGYGTVSAGYARAREIPVVIASPEGERIPRPLRGIATMEVYYRTCHEVAERIDELVPAPATHPHRTDHRRKVTAR